MYRLYTRPGSGGFVVEAVLEQAGIEFERIHVDNSDSATHSAEFLAISPLGQVPALVLPDGQSMTESAAICIHLADSKPTAELSPAPGSSERAAYLRWMLFMSSVLYPAMLRYFYSSRYTSDPDGATGVENAAISEMDRAFAVLDQALNGKDFLVGGRLSAADLYLFMLVSWHPKGVSSIGAWPDLSRHFSELKSNAVVRELNVSHRLW